MVAISAVTAKRTGLTLAWYFVVLIGMIVTLFPVVWGFVSSFRPNPIIFRYITPLSLMTFSPTPFSLEAYFEIFEKGFGRALFNTFFVTASTVGLGLIVNSMGGIVFAKMRFPGKNLIFMVTVFAYLVPFQAIAIPLFMLIRALGWTNSYQALIIPATLNGVVILLFRQFFMAIPDDYVDSAKIDGAPWRTIYWRLFLPMSGPALISAGLILFLDIWLAFLWPLIANPSREYAIVQVAIARLTSEYGVFWNEQFAAATITAVIPVIILMSLQKYYIRAVTGSEIKG